jgi:hypothetical protein
MKHAAPEVLRHEIEIWLASGLPTEFRARADTAESVINVVTLLRTEAGNDMRSKLVVGGFTNHPVRAGGMLQACKNCMYFMTHRQHCELPEIDLPVKPHWSCRLWRI